ncbi:hypothetical protein A2U01_0078593, partial [Trifolium medium]|nr:hypothetical protein [Trifolium medium]
MTPRGKSPGEVYPQKENVHQRGTPLRKKGSKLSPPKERKLKIMKEKETL